MFKVVILFLLVFVVYNLFNMTKVVNLIYAGIDYVTSGPIGSAISNSFSKIFNLFDTVILNSESSIITSSGVSLGNIVWLGTIVRIVVVLLLVRLILKVVL